MSVVEFALLLLLLVAGVMAARLYALENLLKGYQGEGRLGLLRGVRSWRPQLLLRLALTAGERRYALDGLPPARIYDIALALPPGAATTPGRLRLEVCNREQVYAVADSAAAGWRHCGPRLCRIAGQGSFPVRHGDRWQLAVSWEPEGSGEGAELFLTSTPLS